MSLIQSVEIGKRGLTAQQTAIKTAGHNVANLSTPGYARQKVVMTNVATGTQGTGVDVVAVQQIRDRFLEARLRTETQTLARWQAQSQWLSRIESFFIRDGEIPLNNALSRFWNSWQDLANDPTSQAAREAVYQRGQTVASEITGLRTHLLEAVYRLNDQIQSDVEAINDQLETVARLNQAIVTAESRGESANDLRDERHRLVTSLSEKLNLQVTETEDQEYVLSVSGRELVRGEHVNQLSLQESVVEGLPRLEVRLGEEPLPIAGGELQGLLQVRDEVVPDLLSQLDTLAESLISQVNALHERGYNPQRQTGLSFFAGSDSSDIRVAVSADQIATSDSATSVSNNAVALSIAQLRTQGQVGETGKDFETFFADLTVQVGLLTQEADRFEQSQSAFVESLKQQQQSVSGVSLDEEMTSLIQFQHAYEAAARYLSTVDELLQSLIQMI